MEVAIDPEKCQGHARCYESLPELFATDDFGHASVRTRLVPGDLEQKAEQVASNCPERAITVVRTPVSGSPTF